jgi:hypothetical protein
MKDGHDHQIGVGEAPFPSGGAGGNCQTTQVFRLGQASKMLGADASQVDGFFFCKIFLARPDSNHGTPFGASDAKARVTAARNRSNSRSVPTG